MNKLENMSAFQRLDSGFHDGLLSPTDNDQDFIKNNNDEALKAAEELIKEWKANIEDIVGQGLKTMRSNLKTLKIEMLRKDNNLDLMTDMKLMMMKTMNETQEKLDKMGKSKVREVQQRLPNPKVNQENNNTPNNAKKTIVNFSFDIGNGYGSLSDLIVSQY